MEADEKEAGQTAGKALAGDPGRRRLVVGAASFVLVLSGLIGALGLWDNESWLVLIPATTFALALATLLGSYIAAPSGRWSARSLRLGRGGAPGPSRTRRRFAFCGALSLLVLGTIGGVRGILGQWDDPILVGFLLLGSGGAILEAIRRSTPVR